MSKTNSLEALWLDLLFLNVAAAGIGDAGGLQPSAVAGSLFVSLHTAYPGEAGAQNTSEASYTSYARVAIARSGAGFVRALNAVSNVAAVTFPTSTGVADDQTQFFWGLGTASAGAGILLYTRHIGSAVKLFNALAATDVVTSFAHGLVVDNRVVFYAPEPTSGGVLPAGITEGTVYWVNSVPTADTFTFSLTQGGANVDITADGTGYAGKCTPIRVVLNTQPTIAAGAQVVVES